LVCAELGKRGFIATPFSGNVPAFDVLVADDLCRTVPIQVKASRSDNWPSDARDWMQISLDPETKAQKNFGPVQIKNPDLIYVYVAIAPPDSGKDRFFILTKAQLQIVCINMEGRPARPSASASRQEGGLRLMEGRLDPQYRQRIASRLIVFFSSSQ
jgi:hypothetical protein